MKMNKMFAGLIAFVAGVALSAGSAFATNGYVGGDFARMKLVPYYETGDSKATMIAIQNLSPQEASTIALHEDVRDLKAYLGGTAPSAEVVTNLTPLLDPDPVADTAIGNDRDTVAGVEEALAKAEAAIYTEHLFIMVSVHDAMGMMMGSATLCLAEHQFGYVILQGPGMQDWQPMDSDQNKILSVMDDEIPAYGYVQVMGEARKFTGCGATAPNTLMRVDNDTDSTNTPIGPTDGRIAAWAIIQDTGMGFFGTEVPVSTISMEKNAGASTTTTDDDGDPELACYTNSNDAGDSNAAAENRTPNTSGNFMMSRCGLIPERHHIRLTGTAPDLMVDLISPNMTTNTNAIARYDIGDESMVYVWLAKGMDTDDTTPSKRRMLDVVVKCEDGTVMMDADIDGNMSPFKVAAPGMVTMIDPTMGDVGMATDMCEGNRGVLRITMPDNSHAGMVFTHITQMMGHYRMNFPGYSMAADGFMADGTTENPTERCTATPTTSCR